MRLLIFLCWAIATHAQQSETCPCRLNDNECAEESQCIRVGQIVGYTIFGVASTLLVGFVVVACIITRFLRKKCCVCKVGGQHYAAVYMMSPEGWCKTRATIDDPCWADAEVKPRSMAQCEEHITVETELKVSRPAYIQVEVKPCTFKCAEDSNTRLVTLTECSEFFGCCVSAELTQGNLSNECVSDTSSETLEDNVS
jgi:hypothetical protein